jgi:hypothetical protein
MSQDTDLESVLSMAQMLLSKEAFVPSGAAPQQGAPAQGAQQPPQGGAGYPPELLQAAQQLGLPIDPQSGQPMDPETGQPIPPEIMAQVVQQMQAQQGAAPPQQQQMQAAPPQQAAPPPQQMQAPPPQQDPMVAEIASAVEQLAAGMDQLGQENQELKNLITQFEARVAEVDGKMQVVMDELKTTKPPVAPMNNGGNRIVE